MNFTIRQKSILKELLKQNTYLSGQYLAELLGVSTRTIRNEIKAINALLNEEKLMISSRNGKGYIIDKQIQQAINNLVESKQLYRIPITPLARINKIISELLLNPKGRSIKELSRQLYISESTAKRDLGAVTKTLENYQLVLAKFKNKKYYIDGKEETIRKMHYHYFFINGTTPIYNDFLTNELIETYRTVKTITTDVLETYKVNITGDTFQSIIVYLAIALFRINHHALIKTVKSTTPTKGWITALIHALGINQLEEKYLVFLINKLLKTVTVKQTTLEKSKDVLLKITKVYDYPYSDSLANALQKALESNPFVKASDYNATSLKREYPQCFEMALSYIDQMALQLEENNLLINLVLTFMIDFEKQMSLYETQKRRVVVVTQANQISQQFLKMKINRFFESFELIKFLPRYQIAEVATIKPDFIIATSPIEDVPFPVIVIDPLLKDYDVTKLRKFIRHLDHRENINFEFANLFRETLFIKHIDASNPIDAIKILHQKLMVNNYTNPTFLDAVLQRERMSSTALGNYVAIPHAISADFSENVIAVGILNQPIQWSQYKVQIVFLININSTSEGKINQIFDTFFEIISSRKKVNRLIKAANYYEFIKLIN